MQKPSVVMVEMSPSAPLVSAAVNLGSVDQLRTSVVMVVKLAVRILSKYSTPRDFGISRAMDM